MVCFSVYRQFLQTLERQLVAPPQQFGSDHLSFSLVIRLVGGITVRAPNTPRSCVHLLNTGLAGKASCVHVVLQCCTAYQPDHLEQQSISDDMGLQRTATCRDGLGQHVHVYVSCM